MPDGFPIPLDVTEERLEPRSDTILIIPTYRGVDTTIATIRGVLRLNPENSFDVLVVDNGGEDLAKIREELPTPRLQTIALRENAGPAGAFYVGMKRALEAGYERFVLSDNDTELLTENGIVILLSKLPPDGFGAVAPSSLALGDPPPKDVLVPRVHWEFLALGRAAVECVGFVDPELFFGVDDYDYVTRLTSAGVPIVRTPDCRCYHPFRKPATLYNWATYSMLRGYLLFIFTRRPSPLALRHRAASFASMLGYVGARLVASLADRSIARTLAIACHDAAKRQLRLTLPANNFSYEPVPCDNGRWVDLESRFARFFPRKRYRTLDPRDGGFRCFERQRVHARDSAHGPNARLGRASERDPS
jgi:GT2 family glycosyltransferase